MIGSIIKKCSYCDSEFAAKTAKASFCSVRCRVAYHRDKRPTVEETAIVSLPEKIDAPIKIENAPEIDWSKFKQINMMVLYNYMLRNALDPDRVIDICDAELNKNYPKNTDFLNRKKQF